jgi:hypothetical protein
MIAAEPGCVGREGERAGGVTCPDFGETTPETKAGEPDKMLDMPGGHSDARFFWYWRGR